MLKCSVSHYRQHGKVLVMIHRDDDEYSNSFTLESVQELNTLFEAIVVFKAHELAKEQ